MIDQNAPYIKIGEADLRGLEIDQHIYGISFTRVVDGVGQRIPPWEMQITKVDVREDDYEIPEEIQTGLSAWLNAKIERAFSPPRPPPPEPPKPFVGRWDWRGI